jgi:hypothetical protein
MATIAAASAQCPVDNRHFRAGEELSYDLYFKYGILYTKAGRAGLSVKAAQGGGGADGYQVSLTAMSTGIVHSFFSIADTLTAHIDRDLVPRTFSKAAHEGDDHTTERTTYTYQNGTTAVKNLYIRNGIVRADTTFYSTGGCTFDMLSIIYYARTLNFDGMKQGDAVPVACVSGRNKVDMALLYQGKEQMEANDGRTYNCHRLALATYENDAFSDRDHAMQIFITADENRVPVRIDSKLKVGATRAILKGYAGLRH